MRKKVVAVSLVHKQADDSTIARKLYDTPHLFFSFPPLNSKKLS